jgi:uncharacterized protein
MRVFMGQILFILVFLVLLDLYVFQAVKTVSEQAGTTTRKWVYIVYWVVTVLSLATLLAVPYLRSQTVSRGWAIYPLALLIGIIIAKLLSVSFFLIDDLRRVIQWVVAQLWVRNTDATPGHENAEAISRSAFLSWLGLGIGGSIFASLLYGFKNQYNYQLRKITLSFPNLPSAFKGLKIIHISDIHSGSFMNKEEVLKGVETINTQQPDVILFTGDLVNDRAGEMEPFKEIFSQLKAPMGVFSTLGNHDYGDYASWPSVEEKAANLQKLKETHAEMGWRLLLDESVKLEKNGASIGLIGVQNISGKGQFHSYGNLQKAHADSTNQPFKILMSHDPSHWDAEVIKQYPDIDLTLSGHTHGMQFGVEIPGFKWSPVQWLYRQWAGLYETGVQKLYVNRGFGFIGYPGRVGILPEITLIELS